MGHRHGACSNDLSQQLPFQEKPSELDDLNTSEIRCTYKNACHATSFDCQSNLQARRIQEARTLHQSACLLGKERVGPAITAIGRLSVSVVLCGPTMAISHQQSQSDGTPSRTSAITLDLSRRAGLT